MSTKIVPQRQWGFTLILTVCSAFGGIALLLILAAGAANPPRAGGLRWNMDSAVDWPQIPGSDDLSFYTAPVTLPSPPFTLEITAAHAGLPVSAWGIWLETQTGAQHILLDNSGYVSVNDSEQLDWFGFHHTRPGTLNRLYLHITPGNEATLRINDEIAWVGSLALADSMAWGLLAYRSPTLEWESIALYAPEL